MPKFNKPKKRAARVVIYKDLDEETKHIEELNARCSSEAPPRGSQYDTSNDYDANPRAFSELPLSRRTLLGLADAKFENMTRIQAAAIPHVLAGRDVLGAAKTGSGKTLAFLVPALEALWRQKWSQGDGLGALIVVPTRELAIQIFDVLRLVGKHYSISAGLLIGGKKEFFEEQKRVVGMSLLVATPGRLLQHLEQTPGFEVGSLQMLALDEADRILDLGFRDQLTSILTYLPSKDSYQTVLFSATQTKSVKDLARLSLHQPEYVAVHASSNQASSDGSSSSSSSATPVSLQQSYMPVEAHEKLDALYSFIKAHLKAKSVVFLATCSQVRFVYECFRTLQPGVPLMCIHGKHKQARRTLTYMNFLAKPAAVLFATDIAARGLDFPEVDWVVQVDAPEDAPMYIHRVGRTARYQRSGKSLLLLLPSEQEALLRGLEKAKVPPLKRLSMNPNMKVSIAQKAAAINASRPEVKRLASKAFTSYVRSVQLMPNKDVFQVSELPLNDFALSLGLATQPPLKFLAADSKEKKEEGSNNKKKKKRAEDEDGSGDEKSEEEEDNQRSENREKKNVNKKLANLKAKIKEEKLRKKRLREGGSDEPGASKSGSAAAPMDSDLLVFKQRHEGDGGLSNQAGINDDDDDDEESVDLERKTRKTKKKETKLRVDVEGTAAVRRNTKVVFGEDGSTTTLGGGLGSEDGESNGKDGHTNKTKVDLSSVSALSELHLAQVRQRLAATAELDKEENKARLREKKLKAKRGREQQEEVQGIAPTLAMASESDDDDNDDDENGSDGSRSGEDGGEESGEENEDNSHDDDVSDEALSSELDSEDDDGDDNDEEVPSLPVKMKAAARQKRSFKSRENVNSVEADEAAVMAMLGGGMANKKAKRL